MTTQTISSSETRLEKLNQVFETFKADFANSLFHTMLWEIFVNQYDRLLDGDHAFVVNVTPDGNLLGIATRNEHGYIPTVCYTMEPRYDRANDVVDKLNEAVFGLSVREAAMIVMSSMRGV